MTLGQTIKYYRTKFNLSQSELGDQIGVSRQAVTKWETDTGMRILIISSLLLNYSYLYRYTFIIRSSCSIIT